MGTITKRPSKRGARYRAEIRIKRDGKIVHREAKTFRTKLLANRWIERREAVLGEREDFERYSVADAMAEYKERFESLGNWGRTKSTTLDFLEKKLGDWDATEITVGQLVRHVTDRRNSTAGPATAGNDLIWLGVVFKALRPLGRNVALQAVQDAMTVCKDQGLIGRAASRSRRPSKDELNRLSEHFKDRDDRASIPMHDLMWFALYSARRQAEITRLRWSDNVEAELTGLVRDAKHPRKKEGNHRVFKYTQEAWNIAQRQPKASEFIFPFNPKSIGAAFTRACKILEIDDLRFHDLRHEGTSRLFESGYSIVEVQQFTLHDDWKVLQRYTNLRPGDVTLR